MPFGKYRDFDDCVRRNADKRDPEAYCAVIMHKIEHPAYQRNERNIAANRAKVRAAVRACKRGRGHHA